MTEEKIFLIPEGPEKPKNPFFSILRRCIFLLVLAACVWKVYDVLWLRHSYLITAYCDCPICINIPEFRDGKFASMRPLYWGGVAADKSIPFKSTVELVPFTLWDWLAVRNLLGNRRDFTVEDRGGKIRGRHIDIFIPNAQGGHQTALQWGARRMRIKINGRWMD